MAVWGSAANRSGRPVRSVRSEGIDSTHKDSRFPANLTQHVIASRGVGRDYVNAAIAAAGPPAERRLAPTTGIAIVLNISNDVLPQNRLCYLAFRISFRETLERMALADQIGCDPHDPFGFLTEVPFLRNVPAHVQLDLLAATWAKHYASESVAANLVDEAVLYSVCETSARVVESEPEIVEDYLIGGPVNVVSTSDMLLASELRSLHLELSREADFLLVSQFEDLPPDEALAVKAKFGLSELKLEPMFEVLGRWYLSPEFLGNLTGLLTGPEVLKTVRILGVR